MAAASHALVSMGQELAHDSSSIGAVTLAILKREGNRFLALDKEVLDTSEVEAIHQMRVTTRRIQVALSGLGDFLPRRFVSLGDDLKPAFHVLGLVRDFDVDIEELSKSCPDSHARRLLISTLSCEREKAAADLALELRSQRHENLLTSIRELTSLPIGSLPKVSKKEAARVAPKVIERRYRKLSKRIHAIDSDSAQEEIHELRKRSKRFRYLVEFFVDVYGKPAKEIVRELKDLQDELGAYIDSQVAIRTLERLRLGAPLDEGARELVKDLIEMHSLRAEDALQALPKARKGLKGKAWKKLQRKMENVRKMAKSGQPLLVVAASR